MNSHTPEAGDHGFVMGLLAGTVFGAGLIMWLAPRTTAEIGQRMADSTRSLGTRASEQYRQVRTRVGDAVDELARNVQGAADAAKQG